MDPPLRETMLVRGDVDAITGFSFTSLLNLEARGVKAEDIVVLPYPPRREAVRQRHHRQPQAPQGEPGRGEGLPEGLRQGRQGSDGQPRPGAIDYVKARDGIINVELEKRRLRMAIDAVVASPDARAEGFGRSCRAAWR
jgi:NitT/TauT family transport system substrate-binding protein